MSCNVTTDSRVRHFSSREKLEARCIRMTSKTAKPKGGRVFLFKTFVNLDIYKLAWLFVTCIRY